jgi:hypothetical protein
MFMKNKMRSQLLILPFAFLIFVARTQESQSSSNEITPSSNDLKTGNMTVGVQVGSLGPGLQFTYTVNPKLNLRAIGSFMKLNHSTEFDESQVRTSEKIMAQTGAVGVISDWRVFKNQWFRLSAGVVYNFNQLIDTRNYVYTKVTPSYEVGSLTLDFTTMKVNPYLGIVLGKQNQDKKVNFLVEFGTLYHGQPKVNFTGEGRIGATSEQVDVVKSNVSNYNFYPVLNFQMNVKIK